MDNDATHPPRPGGSLKDRSKSEKKAIAGVAAVAVAVLIFFAWGYWFIKKIQRGERIDTIGTTLQEQFNFETMDDMQYQFEQLQQYSEDELRAARESAASREVDPIESSWGGDGTFGAPESTDF